MRKRYITITLVTNNQFMLIYILFTNYLLICLLLFLAHSYLTLRFLNF